MKEHPINDLLNISLDSVVRMVDSGKIAGQPIHLGDDQVIIPISKVTFGFGAGGSEFDSKNPKKKSAIFDSEVGEEIFPFGGGSGGGVSISPLAFIVVNKGKVEILYSERGNTVYDKLFDFVTQFSDKLKK